jgi:hypothetical protein
LDGLEALGNAAAVPVIIFLTQLIKKRVGDFKYGSDILALFLSLILCTGWFFYEMTPAEYAEWSVLTGLDFFKWGVDQTLVGFATWLAASKIYDLGHGTKKKSRKVEAEKKELKDEIVKLKNGNGHGEEDEETVENPEIADKLRDILEG